MDRVLKSKKLCFFIGWNNPNYSRSSVLLNYDSKEFTKVFLPVPSDLVGQIKVVRGLKKATEGDSIIVVMSPCHKLALLARIFTRAKIVLDAGWPLTDGVLSRGLSTSRVLYLIYIYLIDLVSFHSAHLVLVETRLQKSRVSKLFLLRLKKIERSLTGFNELFNSEPSDVSSNVLSVKRLIAESKSQLVVIFRGKINSESGIENILGAARLVESEVIFLLATSGAGNVKKVMANCIEIPSLTNSEMAELYEISDIALGQLSNHPRLKLTIPHKAFEGGYFGKCYLSANSRGLREWLTSKEAFLIDDVSPEGIADSLRVLKDKNRRNQLSSKIKKRYNDTASQLKINQEFEKTLKNKFVGIF